MNRESSDFCEFCEGKLHKRVVRARFSYMGQTIYIDQVPARVCDRCGEQYYDGRVYERLVEIAKDPAHVRDNVVFPLARYDTDGPLPADARQPLPSRTAAGAFSLSTYCSPAPAVRPNAYAAAGPDVNESPLAWSTAAPAALSG
jgi:YgiT-type zinc finger domain-containing protein